MALLAILCVFIPTTVFADDKSTTSSDDSYTIAIPAELNIDTSTNKGQLNFTAEMEAYKKLTITVESENGFKLSAGGKQSIDYSIDDNSFEFESTDMVKTFNETINASTDGDLTYAGEFKDKLNFVIGCENIKNDAILVNGLTFRQLIPSGDGYNCSSDSCYLRPNIITFTSKKMPSSINKIIKLEASVDEENVDFLFTYGETEEVKIPYYFLKGTYDESYNFILNTDEINNIAFDVSQAQDGSIVAWYEKEDTDDNGSSYHFYISTQDPNVTLYANPDSSFMFAVDKHLTEINFDNFDTSKVTNMKGMFAFDDGDRGYSKLKTLDLSGFDTSNVTDMSYMFYCRGWSLFNSSDLLQVEKS